MEEVVDYRDTTLGEDPPVTAVASRRVRLGREREFEDWLSGILTEARKAPGYRGSEVLRPSNRNDDDHYRIVFRFDRVSNLQAWENSEERFRRLREVRPLLHEDGRIDVLTGLETWFTLPSKPGQAAPPRYKIALVTWLALFPLITLFFVAFDPLLSQLPTLLRMLVLTAVMVTVMTYMIMPRLTRLFSFWLYPNHE